MTKGKGRKRPPVCPPCPESMKGINYNRIRKETLIGLRHRAARYFQYMTLGTGLMSAGTGYLNLRKWTGCKELPLLHEMNKRQLLACIQAMRAHGFAPPAGWKRT